VDCVADFIEQEGLQGQSLPLGFTFSFALKHDTHGVGRLVGWAKTFTCSGVEGEDVGKLLQSAIEESPVGNHTESVFE